VVVDQRWDLVSANSSAMAVMTEGVAPHLLRGRVNTLRVSLHPDGLAPRIVNLAEYSAHLITRLQRQAAVAGDRALTELADELRGYPGVGAPAVAPEPADLLFVPLRLRTGEGELRFFSTIATFGTALDVTLAELAIESFFPADAETAALLQASSARR
jgi:hypothetical protein